MTLLPSSDFGIRGVDGEKYDVNEICSKPGCGSRSVHGHHMWPRSYLRGQPYEYVQLPDGTIIGNRIGLCLEHHNMVTGEVGGHRARILFVDGLFFWEEKLPPEAVIPEGHSPFKPVGMLDPQPRGVISGDPGHDEDPDICSECGKPLHTSKPHKPSAPRETEEWTLLVPKDAEIGREVLDEMADEFATILGFDDATSRLRRYHAVATLMAWGIQNRRQFVSDLQEARKA